MTQQRPDSPFEHIFAGVAEDARSDNAIRAAVQLSEKLGAGLELIHAVPVRGPGWLRRDAIRAAADTGGALTQAWEAVGEHLKAALSDCTCNGKPLESMLRILPGHPAKVLLDQSERKASGLIMIGPHGRDDGLDFGATARAILAKAECPVWVQVDEPREIRRVLVPVDLSEQSDGLLTIGSGVARALNAHVAVLSCYVGPSFAYAAGGSVGPSYVAEEVRASTEAELGRLVSEFEWEGVSHETLLVENDPAEEILAQQETSDLIVLGTHGRTRFSAAVLGSTAYSVLRSAHVPVLAIRQDGGDWLV